MKIVTKNLIDVNGSIATDENGNVVIVVPPMDENGFHIVRVDVSGLKDVTTASAIVYIEDRSDDIARIQEITSRALEIKARLTDTENPPSETEKGILYAELAELNKQLKMIDPNMNIYELIG